MKAPTVGDRVRYRRAFLKSICAYTGALPFARGVVLALETLGSATNSIALARVDWQNDYANEVPERVNVVNLETCR